MYKDYQYLQEIMTPEQVKAVPLTELPQLCDELRQELIAIIATTGGHIGVNLGVIELTVALYYSFDFPNDGLVWDIGHQIYIQKMLTGRLPLLKEIRQNGGSPGYAYRPESEFERVTSSHAGASLSLALGASMANRLKGNTQMSIAVTGDGSLVEGSIQEALNHMAADKGRTLLIINDNEMALDKNFGGLHEHLKAISRNPEKSSNVFTELGLQYQGPIDGHDVIALVQLFKHYDKELDAPAVLHIKTIKGKGLESMADNSPVRIHWNFPFNTETLENTEGPKSPSHAGAFAQSLGELLEQDDKVFVITPATLQNTGIYKLSQQYPQRVIDVGMAEQHSITLGCGMALEGIKPIICFESTFLQRVYDQIIHDACISNIPILMVAARSGHTGLDHCTHHSLLDLSYLRIVPNLRVLYPADQEDLKACLKREAANLNGPTLILFPYGGTIDDPQKPLELDYQLSEQAAEKTLILSVGMQHLNAQKVRAQLQAQNINSRHIAVTCLSTMEPKLKALLQQVETIITLEENILDGGLGSFVFENIENGSKRPTILRYGFPKKYIEHGTRDWIYKKYHIDAESISLSVSQHFAQQQQG
ncbi:1-deoxy-D-xylulose-5-phosphate synthase [Dasania marina]|uniref:1-deoxy-D-xylulose-5-phosphate synthase n=1 Tax=Dasania marina TaxID=471499 RepID=UPI00035C2C22|nr:1-deoxy-D-xylulose-5-phosphate synthase [Dasania marina]